MSLQITTDQKEKLLPESKTDTESTDSDNNVDNSDSSKVVKVLSKITKLVVPVFLLLLVFSIVALIIGMLDTAIENTLVWEVLGTSLGGGLFGAWGVYKWGTVQEEIDRLKGENGKYEGELSQLRVSKEQLTGEVSQVQSTVDELKGSVDGLNQQLGAFDDLRQELEKVAGSNQDISTMLDNTTKIFRDLRTVALANEKASLLSIYYEVAFKDGEPGMSAKEYERFKGRLPKKQREQFEAMGTFKQLAGDNDTIDLDEFQVILEKFLSGIERELVLNGFENA
jgi:chaperonin cofactor prefoldin